jgi:hypothetical protein
VLADFGESSFGRRGALQRARMTGFFAQLISATSGWSFGKNFIISLFIIVFG